MIFKWEENGDFKTRCESFHINKYIYIYIYIYIERERERGVHGVVRISFGPFQAPTLWCD